MPVARLSVWSALACKDPEFWEFLQVSSEIEAIEVVRTKCGVQSRAEFDSDPAAAARLAVIIRHPFSSFTQRRMSMKKQDAAPALKRNKNGYGALPGFETFTLPEEDFAPGAVVDGNEVRIVTLLSDDSAVAANWLTATNDVSAWTPTRPEGDDWILSAVIEAEEGPFAVWARPGVHGVLTGKDYAQEFLLGSLIKACTKHLKTLAKPWGDLKEAEQHRVLGTVANDCRQAVKDAIDVIASNGRLTFTAAVDQVVFKDGVKAVLSLAKGDWAHSLADAEGGYVTIVIEERSKLLDEGDALKVEKDQKSLIEA